MTREDWLVGADRRSEAEERIFTAAAELVSQQGFDAFTIDGLAARVHCSPATIYRRAGGKKEILEGVVHRLSTRIVHRVTDAIEGLQGSERVVTALVVALEHIRSEPLGPLMMGAIRPDQDNGWLTASPLVADLAERMIGRADPVAAQWLIRVTLALWYFPIKDRELEHEIAARFIGPTFGSTA